MREPGDEGGLDQAIFRLERAVNQLEHRVGSLVAQAEGANGGLFDQDRAKLAAELDAARSRERELEQAGALASRFKVPERPIQGDLGWQDAIDELRLRTPDIVRQWRQAV